MSKKSAQAADAFIELCSRDPKFFREHLIVDGERWGDKLSDVQRQDFAAIDPAIKYLAARSKTKSQYQQFWLQRSRGFSKTTDRAADALWTYAFSKRPIKGLVCAKDRDQANLHRDSVRKFLAENAWLNNFVVWQRNVLYNKDQSSSLKYITSDVGSSYGETPDFLIADELTHWEDEEFWSSIYSSFLKRSDHGAVLEVACNAGKGVGWQYTKMLEARNDPSWYFHAPEGASPWYSDETLRRAKIGLSPSEFARLFENKWQSGSIEYLSLEECDACIDHSLRRKDSAHAKVAIHIAVLDYAEKADYTAGVVMHLQDEDQVVIDQMDVVTPNYFDGGYIPVDWCEQWMNRVNNSFGTGSVYWGDEEVERRVIFLLDPNQLVWLCQKYEAYYNIIRITFGGGSRVNHEIARALLHFISHKKITWYPGCGHLEGSEHRDDLSTEIAALQRIEKPSGLWTVDHTATGHNDRAFVVGSGLRFIQNAQITGNYDTWD